MLESSDLFRITLTVTSLHISCLILHKQQQTLLKRQVNYPILLNKRQRTYHMFSLSTEIRKYIII